MPARRQKILDIARNEALLKSRAGILGGAGYEVVPALDLRALAAACETREFDLVILGQALPKDEKRRVMKTVRQLCGGVPMLELHPHGEEPVDQEAQEMLAHQGEADELLRKVKEMLARKNKARRAAS